MNLLWLLVVFLFVAWFCGFAVFHVAGGFIHLLLILILVVVLFRLFSGRGRPI